MRMNTAEAVVESLIRHGIDVIFGVPGAHNDAFFDALHKNADRIRTIHTRHEQTAGYMALGAALASGKPQALIVVPGPGMLNASAALLTAYAMNVPILALVGQIQQGMIDRGFGYLHEIHDQLGVLRHYTKYVARISHPAEAGELVADALAIARSGRSRPVALECARDVWPRAADLTLPAPRPVAAPPLDRAALARAAEILGRATKPLIVVGGGATEAGAEVAAIAEALEAPVVSYRRGRGVIPTTHRLAVSLPEGHRLWKDADVVLGIGTRLFPYLPVWGTDANLAVVRIDVDAEEAERYKPPAATIIGDAAPALRALLPLLPRTPRLSREAELQEVRGWLATELEKCAPQMRYLAAIRRALPESGIFVGDVTQLGYASYLGFRVPAPRLYLSAGYQHNLGWSFGAALGAKVAKPAQPVVCITGDGGFLYQANELATAVRHNIAVVVIVADDDAYGNVRRAQELRYGNRLIASDLINPDFVAYARSFGVAAFRATTPEALEAALRDAIALEKPALIHAPVGPMPDIWSLLGRPRVRGT